MPRKPKPSFVLDLPLDTSSADVRRLEDRFLCGKRLSNVMLQEGIRIVAAIRADERWAAAREMPRATEDQRIARGEAFKAFRKEAVKRKGEVKCGKMKLNDFSSWLIEQQNEFDRLMDG